MTPDQIQQKIFYGYAKAGLKLGATFKLYRSAFPINPLSIENFVGELNASMSVSWDYMKASSYGNAFYNCCIDAQRSRTVSARVGDYLSPTEGSDGHINDNNIYYVQSLQMDLPPRVVQCNRTLHLIRPNQDTGPGYIGYAGYEQETSLTLMQSMPASVLKMGSDRSAATKLPTDTEQPKWLIYMPILGNVTVRVGDIVIDELNENYVVYQNEQTDLGWRIVATQVVNSR